jgi:DNA modification methylase
MKPVELLGRLIKNSSKRDWLVLDPFGGSGSALIACEQLGREARMMEIDTKYCTVILDRWESLSGQDAKKIQEGPT